MPNEEEETKLVRNHLLQSAHHILMFNDATYHEMNVHLSIAAAHARLQGSRIYIYAIHLPFAMPCIDRICADKKQNIDC